MINRDLGQNPDVLVYFMDDTLVFSNVGEPFTPAGVEAICTAHQSSKNDVDSSDFRCFEDSVSAINAIRSRHLDEYERSEHRLYEDARSELESRRDYGGRVLLELLQNADDAHSDEKIGHKGLGFKSVLNISPSPRVYSKNLALSFDHDRAWDLLCEKGLTRSDLPHPPILRLPFTADATEETAEIQSIIESFDTTVVLPLGANQKADDFLLDDWKECESDPSLLLFLHSVASVAWLNAEERSDWEILRSGTNARITVHSASERTENDWLLKRSDRVSLAVPLRDGYISCEKEFPSLRSYFPTKEPNPFPCVLAHLELDLKQDRDRFRWNENKAETSNVVSDYVSAFHSLLDECRSPGTALDLMQVGSEYEYAQMISDRVLESARARPVIPGTGLLWRQIRLAPRHVSRSRELQLEVWDDFKLVAVGGEDSFLYGMGILPVGEEAASRQTVLARLSELGSFTFEELAELPLFRTIDDKYSAAQSSHLFEIQDPKKSPKTQCESILYSLVNFDYSQIGDENLARRKRLSEFIREIGIPAYAPDTILRVAVLPVLREGIQPINLMALLYELKATSLSNEDAPLFDWRNSLQAELAQRLLLQTREGKGLPPSCIYFGSDWGSNSLLEELYRSDETRGFLPPPDPDWDDATLSSWKAIYTWLGVARHPKILPLINEPQKSGNQAGSLINRWHKFPLNDSPPQWDSYCEAIAAECVSRFDPYRYSTRMRKNWVLDLCPERLRRKAVFNLLLEGWEEEYSHYLDSLCYRSSSMSQDHDNMRFNVVPYWLWELREKPWVTDNDGGHHPLRDVFLPGEVSESLAFWVVSCDTSVNEGAAMELGVRRLWSDLDPEDWVRWLNRSVEIDCAAENGVEARKEIDQFYRVFLRRAKGQWSATAMWSAEKLPDGSESWTNLLGTSDIYFVDWPQHERLRLRGLHRLPVSLGNYGAWAKEKLSLKLLSDHLVGAPIGATCDGKSSNELREHLKSRKKYLLAYFMTQYQESTVDSISEAIDKFCLQIIYKLEIQYSLDRKNLGEPVSSVYYFDRKSTELLLDREACLDASGMISRRGFDSLAWGMVFSFGINQSFHGNIRDVLSYPSSELLDKLVDLGVTENDIAHFEESDLVGGSTIDAGLNQVDPIEPNQPTDGEPPSGDGNSGPIDPDKPEELGEPQGEPDEPDEPDEQSVPGGASTPPNGDGGSKRKGGFRGPGNSGGSKGGKKKGGKGKGGSQMPFIQSDEWKKAEEYLRSELAALLGEDGWSVSQGPVRDDNAAETDVLLQHADYGEYHIEVKHLSGSTIFWTELEFKKAQGLSGRYFMALLTTNVSDSSEFTVNWLFDPEQGLRDNRKVESWRWYSNKTEDGVELDDWEVRSDRPVRVADGYAFRIEVDSFESDDFTQGIEALIDELPG